ncbi:DUF4352 domain-containing protein [Microterricola pindariensis]|uniref:DUF4352 domain-containing protein n=1 Tax=Microterricola pindariensis TaxID=478010 RepID=A0ABX5AV07_9MICO|nr:DUF4352 domain-containing protein [Microterricola pindariensis]PPL18748.1 hypothetical protein GY24_09550 [Microterricola pindariensis]
MFSRFIYRRSALVAGAALVVTAALTGCSAGASNGGNSTVGDSSGSAAVEEAPAEAVAAPETPGLNVPVTVGAFEFTALSAADAGTTVGAEPFTQTAQGTYYQLDLKIMNVGNDSQTFIVNYVTLEDAEGKSYDADSSASLYAGGDAQTWLSAINPGNAVQGPILFDIPAGVTPVKLHVSDNMFTDGTAIQLG